MDSKLMELMDDEDIINRKEWTADQAYNVFYFYMEYRKRAIYEGRYNQEWREAFNRAMDLIREQQKQAVIDGTTDRFIYDIRTGTGAFEPANTYEEESGDVMEKCNSFGVNVERQRRKIAQQRHYRGM